MKVIGLILLFLNGIIFGQENGKAFSFAFTATTDFTNNFNGGLKENKPAYMGHADLVIDFNTENAGLWKGGIFTAHLLNTHGATPSAENVGDLQVFSNIEAGSHTGIFELYFTQTINSLILKAGWNNLNADFYWTNFGGLFLNSSFGISPAASLNVPLSIFPVTSPFIFVGYNLNKTSLVQFASYAGNPGDIETNKYNLKWDLSSENGLMNILEYQYINGTKGYFGFKAGGYIHTSDVKCISDSSITCKNCYGLYAIIDKNLLPPKAENSKGLDAFLQFDFAPADRCMVNYYVGTGLSYHGFFNSEKVSDEIGIAVAHMGISKNFQKTDNNIKKHETAVELTYRIGLFDHLFIQPDFQYIINPGAGTNGNLQDAFVGSVRLILCN